MAQIIKITCMSVTGESFMTSSVQFEFSKVNFRCAFILECICLLRICQATKRGILLKYHHLISTKAKWMKKAYSNQRLEAWTGHQLFSCNYMRMLHGIGFSWIRYITQPFQTRVVRDWSDLNDLFCFIILNKQDAFSYLSQSRQNPLTLICKIELNYWL